MPQGLLNPAVATRAASMGATGLSSGGVQQDSLARSSSTPDAGKGSYRVSNPADALPPPSEVLRRLEAVTQGLKPSNAASLSSSARLERELAELRASRPDASEVVPLPSAWARREHRYRQDLEKYEHTVSMQRAQIENLEVEISILREGGVIAPLEQRIEELEQQLRSTAEEKVKVQSKFHELSLKHRQLIENSPRIATIWREVLMQQQRTGSSHADDIARLKNFDLRHTGASSGGLTAALPPLRTAPASVSTPSPTAPRPTRADMRRAPSGSFGDASECARSGSMGAPQPGTPPPAEHEAALTLRAETPAADDACSSMDSSESEVQWAEWTDGYKALQTSEERTAALMASVQLEGLTPEAKVAALQQLNYDLTMQLELYQRMVARLKDWMEHADLVRAELTAEKEQLQAEKAQLEAQVLQLGADASRRWGSGLLNRLRGSAAAEGAAPSPTSVATAAGGEPSLPLSRSAAEGEGDGSAAEAVAKLQTAGSSSLPPKQPTQQGTPPRSPPRDAISTAAAAAADSSAAATGVARARLLGRMWTRAAGIAAAVAPPDTSSPTASSPSNLSPMPTLTDEAAQQLAREAADRAARQATEAALKAAEARAAKAAAEHAARDIAADVAKQVAENLARELEDCRVLLGKSESENQELIVALVQIKMELADVQGANTEFKRQLARAMDRESCMELRVKELQNMLDRITSIPLVAEAITSGDLTLHDGGAANDGPEAAATVQVGAAQGGADDTSSGNGEATQRASTSPDASSS